MLYLKLSEQSQGSCRAEKCHKLWVNIIRDPTFGDFVTVLTEGSMQDTTVARLQNTRVQTPLSPLY